MVGCVTIFTVWAPISLLSLWARRRPSLVLTWPCCSVSQVKVAWNLSRRSQGAGIGVSQASVQAAVQDTCPDPGREIPHSIMFQQFYLIPGPRSPNSLFQETLLATLGCNNAIVCLAAIMISSRYFSQTSRNSLWKYSLLWFTPDREKFLSNIASKNQFSKVDPLLQQPH